MTLTISTEIFRKTWVRWTLIGLAAVLIAALSFRAGVAVGLRKANFSYRWGEQYHRNFAGPRGGFFAPEPGGAPGFIEPHGVFGLVLRLDGETLIISGQDQTERAVVVDDQTVIRRQRQIIGATDLATSDQVVIIGDPTDDGRILAKFIRVTPGIGADGDWPKPLRGMMPRP